jgi:hypothetical protein
VEVEPTLRMCLTRVDANRAMWNDIVTGSERRSERRSIDIAAPAAAAV